VDRSTLALRKVMCHPSGQQCAFSPPLALWAFPLQKGMKWETKFTAKGETFTADLDMERKVDRVEKVRVPAGEFEAYKISFKARIKSTDEVTTHPLRARI
jgi:hypothetical protein